jgi:hypothetical protein
VHRFSCCTVMLASTHACVCVWTTACLPGSYSGDAAAACAACPTASTSSSSASTCICNAGYRSSGTGGTLVCTGTLPQRLDVLVDCALTRMLRGPASVYCWHLQQCRCTDLHPMPGGQHERRGCVDVPMSPWLRPLRLGRLAYLHCLRGRHLQPRRRAMHRCGLRTIGQRSMSTKADMTARDA